MKKYLFLLLIPTYLFPAFQICDNGDVKQNLDGPCKLHYSKETNSIVAICCKKQKEVRIFHPLNKGSIHFFWL